MDSQGISIQYDVRNNSVYRRKGIATRNPDLPEICEKQRCRPPLPEDVSEDPDSGQYQQSARFWDDPASPHVSIAHRVLLWPGVFRHVRESGLSAAVSEFQCVMRLGTPWLLKKETPDHLGDLPCNVGCESFRLKTASVIFPSLTVWKVNEYTAAYFNTFNRLLPLLISDIFMDRIASRLLQEGYRDDDPEGVLALLVFALGQLAIEGTSGRPSGMCKNIQSGFRGTKAGEPPGLGLFNEARRRIGLVATKCRLENVQILLLQATYFEASARHSHFWSSVSAASMACMHLIKGQSIDWSSTNGDLVKRAYWICVVHERLFDLDLKVASTGIESMEDQVPLPHFHGSTAKGHCPLSAPNGVRSRVGEGDNHNGYHFSALVALSRLLRRASDIVRDSEPIISEPKSLRQTLAIACHLHPAPHGPTSANGGRLPWSLIRELTRQLESWRDSLPQELQWNHEEMFDFAKIEPLKPSSPQSFLRHKDFGLHEEVDQNASLALIQVRVRFYHALFMIHRPFVYKALHTPELMIEDDRTACACAIKSACLWPVCLLPPKNKKHLVPHMFSWTQNILATLLILRLTKVNSYLGEICSDACSTNGDLERSNKAMTEWLEDVSQVDGIAEWSVKTLGPLLYGDFRGN